MSGAAARAPLVIAHRGASGERPENTLAAYSLAVEQRADMIEIDLHRTRDGAIVIAHDERLAGLPNGREIAECTLAEVRAVMTAALDQGGTSFDALYVNVNGESGWFDRSLEAYGQAGRPCSRCGTPIRRTAFMNRSSYACPRCQPTPRRAHW